MSTASTGTQEQQPKFRGQYRAESHEKRTAGVEAAFFTKHLRPGMRVLDVGCGTGSITVGLGAAVPKGEVIGIDVDPRRLEPAIARAEAAGVHNVSFQPADIYALPFPDGAFDAAFENSVLQHLDDPIGACREVLRVLKPGGFFATRSPDVDGMVASGPTPEITELVHWSMQLYADWRKSIGTDVASGKEGRRRLSCAGFTNVTSNVAPVAVGTDKAIREVFTYHAGFYAASEFIDWAVSEGRATPDQMEAARRAYLDWAEHPLIGETFYYNPRIETIGWKP